MRNILDEIKSIPISIDIDCVDYWDNKVYYQKEILPKITLDVNNPKNMEAMLSCDDFGLETLNYYNQSPLLKDSKEAEPYLLDKVLLRKSILQDLQKIDIFIRPFGLKLAIMSGYRHPKLQKILLDKATELKGEDFAKKNVCRPIISCSSFYRSSI